MGFMMSKKSKYIIDGDMFKYKLKIILSSIALFLVIPLGIFYPYFEDEIYKERINSKPIDNTHFSWQEMPTKQKIKILMRVFVER